MVSILQYQYEIESDPESGDEERQAEPHHTRLLQMFLNGNLPIFFFYFINVCLTQNSIKRTGYYIHKQRTGLRS